MLFYTFLTIFILSIICHVLIFVFLKRNDVSIYDAYFTFPAKYGMLWFTRKPEVYFRKEYLKYVFIPFYFAFVTLFLIIVSLLLAKTTF